jgi:hypothetical protein
MKAALLLLLSLAVFAKEKKAAPAIDPKVVGSWAVNGSVMFVFKADGTGKSETDAFKWSVKDKKLLIKTAGEEQKVAYGFMGEQLVLRIGWIPVTLDKVAGASSKSAGAKGPSKEAPAGGGSVSRLLLSSAWCSFSYNKISGASHQKKVVFSPNGTWAAYSQGEGYSSGSGGTYASQTNAQDGGQWKEQSGQLYLSSSESPSLQPVGFQVKQNSNGFPIIVSDGVEYSQCR